MIEIKLPNKIPIKIFSNSKKQNSGESISGQGHFEGFVLGCGSLVAIGGLLLGAYIILVNNHIIGP